MRIKVHAANIHDTVVGCEVILAAFKKYPSLKIVCADAGYRKTFKEYAEISGLKVEISEKIKPKEWAILPKGWRVERTLAWLNGSRRLSKDYEITKASAENRATVSHLTTLLRRF